MTFLGTRTGIRDGRAASNLGQDMKAYHLAFCGTLCTSLQLPSVSATSAMLPLYHHPIEAECLYRSFHPISSRMHTRYSKEVFTVHISSSYRYVRAEKGEEASPCTSQPLSRGLSDWRAGSRKRRNVLRVLCRVRAEFLDILAPRKFATPRPSRLP